MHEKLGSSAIAEVVVKRISKNRVGAKSSDTILLYYKRNQINL